MSFIIKDLNRLKRKLDDNSTEKKKLKKMGIMEKVIVDTWGLPSISQGEIYKLVLEPEIDTEVSKLVSRSLSKLVMDYGNIENSNVDYIKTKIVVLRNYYSELDKLVNINK